MEPTRHDVPSRPYDVIIIGAGINGASSARELALAGYSVLLVDKDDFAAGASSRSSRILHCGLRYFETSRPLRTFALNPVRLLDACRMARAAMFAREELVRLEPERCRPITMCFPIYHDGIARGWQLDLAFTVLRLLGPAYPPLDYRRLTTGIDKHLPFAGDLRRQGLQAVSTYREYMIDWPERLCVDAAIEAEQLGATIRTFCEARIIGRGEDGMWSVQLKDRTGQHTGEAKAKNVLNMAGPWIDAVNRSIESENGFPRQVQGTKGVHISVRLPRRFHGFGLATLNRSGAPFYCLPLFDDLFYFGPTETAFDGDPGNVSATDEEIDWLLEEANHLLPGIRPTRADVESAWAGVRPLTYDSKNPMGRRNREIHDGSTIGCPGLFAMTAGPIMSHRSGARAVRRLMESCLQPGKEPVGGHAEIPQATHRAIPSCTPDSPAALRYSLYRKAVKDEHAIDLRGVLYTRTGEAWRNKLSREYIEAAANSIADLLGWSSQKVSAEVDKVMGFQNAASQAAMKGSGSPAHGNAPRRCDNDVKTCSEN